MTKYDVTYRVGFSDIEADSIEEAEEIADSKSLDKADDIEIMNTEEVEE